ncbi:SDR family oxidoreductase [Acinetobacter tandoii]|nr:SDR family oxidoreductase [Acinetobacter tandoii]
MAGRLAGKNIIIIGGTSGMGAAQVRLFHKEGAKLVVANRSALSGVEMFSDIAHEVLFVKHDVSKEKDWIDLIDKSEQFFNGPIDGMINNAGVLVEEGLLETSLEGYQTLVDIMQTGAFLGMKYSAQSMLKTGTKGSIITVSSTAGIVGFKGIFAYTATKWAVRGMTKAAALDLAEAGIRVNSIHPGDTETPMIEGFGYDPNGVPMKRFAKPEEIGFLALFLLSDDSQYITGAEHIIDGGYTAQ